MRTTKGNWTYFFLVAVLSFVHVINGSYQGKGFLHEPGNVTAILQKIFKDYEKAERPFYREKRVIIYIKLEITAISHINEENMQFEATLHFNQFWTDPRLAYDNNNNNSVIYLLGDNLNKIWLPDTYIENARKFSIDSNTPAAALYGNGNIHYAYRVTSVILSPMDFHYYPMDHQKLTIKLNSFFHNNETIDLKWKLHPWVSRQLAGYVIDNISLTERDAFFQTGYFSFLSLSIILRRRLGYFIMQFYLPCVLCAVVSWLPFWMDRYEIGDRMALSITTLLTEVFLSQYINSSMPRVSYIKAADEYLLATFIFIFVALMENILVYNLRPDVREQNKKLLNMMAIKNANENGVELESLGASPAMRTKTHENQNHDVPSIGSSTINYKEKDKNVEPEERDKSLIVDKVFRILCPVIYLTFFIYYFSRYSNYYLTTQV